MSPFDVLVGYIVGMLVGGAIATWFAASSWRRLVDTLRDDRNEWRGSAKSLAEQLARLTQQLVGLKRKGFEPSTAGKIVRPPDPEAKALREMEAEFTQKLHSRRAEAEREFEESAVDDLVTRGLTREQAIAEARRLRSEVTDMHPAGG